MTWWKRLSGNENGPDPADAPLDAQLRQLREARSVAFGGVGFASQIMPETEAYFALEERIGRDGAALRLRLESLLAKASPAGRVYAAELLSRVDREIGELAWQRLSGDHDPLATVTGCMHYQTTVADYAAQRLTGGASAGTGPADGGDTDRDGY
jgi:hypothetical protein